MEGSKGVPHAVGAWDAARRVKQARSALAQAGDVHCLWGRDCRVGDPLVDDARDGKSDARVIPAARDGHDGPVTPLGARGVKRKADAANPPTGLISTLVGISVDEHLSGDVGSACASPDSAQDLARALARHARAGAWSAPEWRELGRILVTRIAGTPFDAALAAAAVAGLMEEAARAALKGDAASHLEALVDGIAAGWCGGGPHLETACLRAVLRPLARPPGPGRAGVACCRTLLAQAMGALRIHAQPPDIQGEAIATALVPDADLFPPADPPGLPGLPGLLQELPGPGGQWSPQALDRLLDHLLPPAPPRRFAAASLAVAVGQLARAVGDDPRRANQLAGRLLASRWIDGFTCNALVKAIRERHPGLVLGDGWTAVAAGRAVPSLLAEAAASGTLARAATAIARAVAVSRAFQLPAAQVRATVVGLAGFLWSPHRRLPGIDAIREEVRRLLLAPGGVHRPVIFEALALAGDPQVKAATVPAASILLAWQVLDHRGAPRQMVERLLQVTTAPLPAQERRALLEAVVEWSVAAQDLPHAILAQWLEAVLRCGLPVADRGVLAARVLESACARPGVTVPWTWLQAARAAIAQAIAHEGPGPERDWLTQALLTGHVLLDPAPAGAGAAAWLLAERRFLERSIDLGLLPPAPVQVALAALSGWAAVQSLRT